METLHGKASAQSAGETDHVHLEPRDKMQGKLYEASHVTFEPRPRRSILSVLFNNQLTATPFRPSSDGAPPTFSKFEEKKNIEKGSRYNTVRRLFWGSSSPPKPQGRSDNFVYSYIVSSVPQSLDFPRFI